MRSETIVTNKSKERERENELKQLLLAVRKEIILRPIQQYDKYTNLHTHMQNTCSSEEIDYMAAHGRLFLYEFAQSIILAKSALDRIKIDLTRGEKNSRKQEK